MQVLNPHSPGKIVAMTGKAVARGLDGKLRMLAVGDWIAQDEVIVTAQNGQVQLAFDDAPRRSAELLPLQSDAALSGAASAPPAPLLLPESTDAWLGPALRVEALDEAIVSSATALTADSGSALAARTATARTGVDRLAPHADGASLHMAEDTPLPISLTGRDPDGSLSSVWVLKVPTGGVLHLADGTPVADRTELTPAEAQALVFMPAPDFNGNPGLLQFMVVDATGKPSAVSTVAITVDAVNDAPLAGTVPLGPDLVAIADPGANHLPGTPDYHLATAEDTAVAGRINATDVDLDPLRFSTAVDPAHGIVVLNLDGAFVYTPNADYQGTDRFTVAVDDGHGGVANSTVFIDVATGAVAAGQEVFAWTLAEPAFSPLGLPSPGPALAGGAEALDPSSVLQGPEHTMPLPGMDPFAAGPATTGTPQHLDLGLDWGLRSGGLDLLRDWAEPAHV